MSTMTGSTMLPDKILTTVVDTKEMRIGLDSIDQISQNPFDNSHTSIPSSKALYEAFMQMKDAVNAIDPDNNFFKDNSVITQHLIPPTFDNDSDDWFKHNWIFDENKAIYTNISEGNDNYLLIPNKTFTSPGYYIFKITIERIDTGRIDFIDDGDNLIKSFNVSGTYYLELYISNPYISTFRFISNDLYPNESVIISYVGVHKVQDRLRDYIAFRLKDIDGSGSGDIDDALQQISNLKAYVDTGIQALTDQLELHTTDINNPHQLTRALLQAAFINHTHDPLLIGASPVSHTHQPEECDAAPEVHTHTPVQCGAAPEVHTHTPVQCGAAPENHLHTEYVAKQLYQLDQSNINQRLAALSTGTTSGSSEVFEPLKIITQNSDIVGKELFIKKDNNYHKRFTFSNINQYRKYAAPRTTLSTNYNVHLARDNYDYSSGIFSICLHGALTTLHPISFDLSITNPVDYPEYVDIIRHGVLVDHLHTKSTVISKIIPIFQNIDPGGNGQFSFSYGFHQPQKINAFRVHRLYNTSMTANLADITANGGCVKKISIKGYLKSTLQFNIIKTFTIAEWSSHAYLDIPILNGDIDCYEVEIMQVFSMSTSYSLLFTHTAVWSFGLEPLFNGTDTNVDIRNGISIIGNIQTDPGVNDITVEIPTSIEIPSKYHTSTQVTTNQLYLVAKSSDDLLVTQGSHHIELYLSPLPLEISEKPIGDANVLCGCYNSITNHPYWGTTNNFNFYHYAESLTNTLISPNTIFFNHVFNYGGQSATGIDFVIFKQQYLNQLAVKYKLTISGTSEVYEQTVPFIAMEGGLREPLNISDTTFSTSLDGSYYRLHFDKIYSNIATIELTLINLIDPTSTTTNLIIHNVLPRLLGLHYNPITRTLRDYQNNINPIGILGKLNVIKTIDNNTKYIAVPFNNDNTQIIKSDTSVYNFLKKTYTVPSRDLNRIMYSIPNTNLDTNKSINVVKQVFDGVQTTSNITPDFHVIQANGFIHLIHNSDAVSQLIELK